MATQERKKSKNCVKKIQVWKNNDYYEYDSSYSVCSSQLLSEDVYLLLSVRVEVTDRKGGQP